MTAFIVRSPGDLRIQVGCIESTPVEPVVTLSTLAFGKWSATSYDERAAVIARIGEDIVSASESFAKAITLETGKTITESREEMGYVNGVIKQALEDAVEFHFNTPRKVGPDSANAEIRHTPRGPVAVITPFNFPVLIPLRSIVPYLLAGNTVIFKPSPMGAAIAEKLAGIFQRHLPEGVLTLVQGGSEERVQLSTDERVRSISFSGNLIAAREVLKAIAFDFSKNLALETGGKNAILLLEDGDTKAAAKAAAYGMCALAGQRGDSTSRAIVHSGKVDEFCEALLAELKSFVPGDPRKDETKLGVLINEAAHRRYAEVLDYRAGRWILRGETMYQFEGLPGYYMKPSVRLWPSYESGISCPITNNEIYAPIIDIFTSKNDTEMVALNNATTYGKIASIYTKRRDRFEYFAKELRVGNIYANMPTTSSHPWLPSCGRRNSNNGKPFGRGFIRYAANELSVQTTGLE
jgi:acyl-CoA reductase-like NAD-dependent aldehyde dehydrogenase